ncbi:MAG: hemerythrin family protein [Spirochaetales bacterium]|nr:hemerythrin family protein [Spirochaetales bacterium]
MEWSNEYSLGINILDRQHKKMFFQINQLVSSLNSNKGNQAILPTLKFLVAYTHYHFETEEEIMIELNYPGYGEHRNAHNLMRKKIRDILQLLKNDEHFSAIELYYFLSNWITDHIENWDSRIKNYMERNQLFLESSEDIYDTSDYIFEQVTIKLETIALKEKKKVITGIQAERQTRLAVTDFFTSARITNESELQTVMNSINSDLVKKQLIDLERKNLIKECIKSTIDIDRLLESSKSKKNLLRFLLEEEFIDITEYDRLKLDWNFATTKQPIPPDFIYNVGMN